MKSIVITGSTRGIGLAMAREFLQAGCRVTLSGRGQDISQYVQDELIRFKDQYIYVPCNVQKKSALQNLWDASVRKWGQIDIWINNAGQNAPYAFSFDTDQCYVENIISTNITGMI